jgi:alanyl-tRNA synthetase/misacylated tRNA(Ala) deacylase
MARIDALRADAVDKEKALRLEVAGTLAEALASTLPNAPGSVANLTRTSAATHDFEFVNAVAGAFFARLADDAAGAGTEVDARAALVLVSAAESPALLLVHARDAERGKKLYEAVRAKLADLPPAPSAAPGPRVKGGGARGRFMAKVEGWNGRDAAAVRTAIEELDA